VSSKIKQGSDESPRLRLSAYPGLIQTAILCLIFLVCFTSGIAYDYIPPWLAFVKGPSREGSIILGIAGMFGCLILFLLGFLVARLK
jgi:hypothetical protein